MTFIFSVVLIAQAAAALLGANALRKMPVNEKAPDYGPKRKTWG